mmetsp:Transcript_4534/g.10272  ORF Transcript_4534/g.10272 Transcript_4534/m.10272 type:complete len:89 (+) Transcript_4534:112-378(+)
MDGCLFGLDSRQISSPPVHRTAHPQLMPPSHRTPTHYAVQPATRQSVHPSDHPFTAQPAFIPQAIHSTQPYSSSSVPTIFGIVPSSLG